MRTSTDFFLSGRSLPPWVTGLAFLSANLGAQEVIGMGASGAKYGIATAHFYWIGAIPAMVFVGLLMMPFSLRCGHTFCFYCLVSLSKHPSVCDICPCCRCYIGQEYPSRNRILESILPHLISKLSEEELNNYLGRKKKMLI